MARASSLAPSPQGNDGDLPPRRAGPPRDPGERPLCSQVDSGRVDARAVVVGWRRDAVGSCCLGSGGPGKPSNGSCPILAGPGETLNLSAHGALPCGTWQPPVLPSPPAPPPLSSRVDLSPVLKFPAGLPSGAPFSETGAEAATELRVGPPRPPPFEG